MALLPVEEALSRVLETAKPTDEEKLALNEAAGRILSRPVYSLRTHPPFNASAMDGYAVRFADLSKAPAKLRIIGQSAAGSGFHGSIGFRETVRIFTGAPVPRGADTVIIQENTHNLDGDEVEILQPAPLGKNIRQQALDFSEGDLLLERGRSLDPAALSLAAAGNHTSVFVWKKPVVALIATGDELVPPGDVLGPDQIISSNSYGVAAIIKEAGGTVIDLGIVPDNRELLHAAVQSALDSRADVVVTLGGASVGDHDFVNPVLTAHGFRFDFWKIAMRPGKPLMFGRLGTSRCLGLPGNPVSSLICSHLFLKPLIYALGGQKQPNNITDAILEVPLAANDSRQDYVRATAEMRNGTMYVQPFEQQDSSLLRALADANCAIIRPPEASPAKKGDSCQIMLLR
ncbi:MAG: molybdopterin molybdotransferase MoeA [Rhizobiaceae bacterium]|nr:molybdopterin molybdotransferase MoeA [Rhizobiaceae bacterium]